MQTPNIYLIDLFCGCGGVTTGFKNAGIKVLACVNHDHGAIMAHKSQHPEVMHYEEDIRDLKVVASLKRLVAKIRLKEENPIIILWASLECTNFSNAKGGKPRDADSRSLADYMDQYLMDLQPELFWVENVREFMAWGPLDENGKPVSRLKGVDFERWKKQIEALGYTYEHKLMNSANYGSCQSRTRLFPQFVKKGLPIVWPEPTHDKHGTNGLLKFRPVKEVLDFDDKGESIFGRKKPLVEKTLQRIMAGLVKFIAGGKEQHEAFLTKYMGNNAKTGINNGLSINEPCNTIATQGRQALVQPVFMVQRNSGEPESKVYSTENPARTITKTGGNQELVQPDFIQVSNGGKDEAKVFGTNRPSRVITASENKQLVQPVFLTKTYGVSSTSDGVSSVNEISKTVTTKTGDHVVQPKFLTYHYSTGENVSQVTEPCRTISTKDRVSVVQPVFINCQFSQGQQHRSTEEPSGSLTTVPKYNLVQAFIIDPQWINNPPKSIDKPSHTLIARMDKTPPYLVQIETGELAIAVYDTDSPTTVKIKEFMAAYGIIDIYMRMLKVEELLQIQSLPKDYFAKVSLTQTAQKKYIGNAVDAKMSYAIAKAIVNNYQPLAQAQTA